MDNKARKAANSREIREQFSELLTVWRARQNSNSQSPLWCEFELRYSGDRLCFHPQNYGRITGLEYAH
jgi:hypothetical protein